MRLQIPLSKFLGRDDGPDWTAHDRHVAMAWMRWEQQIHEPCGRPLDEVTDPDNEWRRDPESGLLVHRWEGQVVHCWWCAATDRAYRRHMDAGKNGGEVDRDGIFVMVRDRDAKGGG